MDRRIAAPLLAAALAAAPAPAVLAAPGGGLRTLRLCHPGGGIRAERRAEGVRLVYTTAAGAPTKVDFLLRGWRFRAAWSDPKGACVELERAAAGATETSGETLRAKDEVYSVGGAFQDKVILRRSRRVIELGGEKIVIEGTGVVSPKTEKKTE